MGVTHGWVTEAEADTYLSTRYGASDFWASGVDKHAALQTAYNMLIASKLFTFPAVATQAMKDAQVEQALFVVEQDGAIDARMGIRVQGVRIAGVVKETYEGEPTIPIAPMAMGLIKDLQTEFDSFVGIIPLTRDRTEDDVI